MNDSRSFLSPSPCLSTLPPELVDEILTQNSLLKSDLARCCLVSRFLLDPARRSLYSSVYYCFVVQRQRLPIDESYALTPSTFKLLETLKGSSVLNEMVATLRLGLQWVERSLRGYPSLTEPVIELLELLKNVTRLRLGSGEFDGVLGYVCATGSRWKELVIRDLGSGLNLASSNIFPNLRKLSCCKVYSSNTARSFYLPPYLSLLEVQIISGPLAIANVDESPLQSLRIANDELLNLPDVSKLPNLQHLYLKYNDNSLSPLQIGNIVNSCQSLTSLSLELFGPGPTDHFFNLLRRISIPGLLLEFPRYIPFNALISLINLGHLKGIRTLAFSQRRIIQSSSEKDLTSLSRICASRGVSIEYCNERWCLFDI